MVARLALRPLKEHIKLTRLINTRSVIVMAAETNMEEKAQDSGRTTITNAKPTPSKRPFDRFKERPPPKSSKRQKQTSARSEGSHEEVLAHDMSELLSSLDLKPPTASAASEEDQPILPPLDSEITLKISMLSSTGSGIAINEKRPYVVSFAYPGDVLKARITRHTAATSTTPAHSSAFPTAVITPGADRDDQLVKCKYFGTCSGCQLQPLPYSDQLAHKQRIIERAYRNFSFLPPNSAPPVGRTIASPLQYGYRTKLTPHFDGPAQSRSARRKGEKPVWERNPEIGFNRADGSRKVLDVEECPIGTEAVQQGLRRERARVLGRLGEYRRGATVLLRESCERVPNDKQNDENASVKDKEGSEGEVVVYDDLGADKDYMLKKTCTSDHRGTTSEYVGDVVFKNPANAFFQNNNSILPSFVDYIRQHVLPPPQSHPSNGNVNNVTTAVPKITNLIDAYCGSGLFSITLSSLFTHTLGIDISSQSIDSANQNLQLNNLDNTADRDIRFVTGDATSLFASADRSIFESNNTAIIIDPPRKGCDESFLTQLLDFAPERVVYVSCNVHTQARDVGWLLRGGRNAGKGMKQDLEQRQDKEGSDGKLAGGGETPKTGDARYELESLQGFDFFPQTAHVESVAILQRIH